MLLDPAFCRGRACPSRKCARADPPTCGRPRGPPLHGDGGPCPRGVCNTPLRCFWIPLFVGEGLVPSRTCAQADPSTWREATRASPARERGPRPRGVCNTPYEGVAVRYGFGRETTGSMKVQERRRATQRGRMQYAPTILLDPGESRSPVGCPTFSVGARRAVPARSPPLASHLPTSFLRRNDILTSM